MSLLVPNANLPSRVVDPVAFSVALFGAPFLFAVFTCWALFIPVAAIAYGGLPYLAFGGPTLMWVLSKGDPDYLDVMALSVIPVLLGIIAAGVYAAYMGDKQFFNIALFFGGFGLFFAPAWTATFLALYRRLRREFYAAARPFS